jgi:hypothetical protein
MALNLPDYDRLVCSLQKAEAVNDEQNLVLCMARP